MSLACPVGPEGNLLEPGPELCQRLWLDKPLLSLDQLQWIKSSKWQGWRCAVLDISLPATATNLRAELVRLCGEAERAAVDHQFLVLSDRNIGPRRAALPALLAAAAVHHHLISARLRSKVTVNSMQYTVVTGLVQNEIFVCLTILICCSVWAGGGDWRGERGSPPRRPARVRV